MTDKGGMDAWELFQPTCLTSEGSKNNTVITHGRPYLGGRFTFELWGYPGQQQSLNANLLIFGTQGVGGTFLGRKLPFLLSSIGLPGRQNCQWAIDYFAAVTMAYIPGTANTANGRLKLSPVIQMPADKRLADLVFYTQNIALDPDKKTTAPKFSTSAALKWHIGDNVPIPGSIAQRMYDNSITTAKTYTRSRAVSLKFDY